MTDIGINIPTDSRMDFSFSKNNTRNPETEPMINGIIEIKSLSGLENMDQFFASSKIIPNPTKALPMTARITGRISTFLKSLSL